ncbi:MAG: EAL domain-containing protein [Butyrivibrio sp.]|nr:EAL domain-containing protein [Butyrivibrio sp.]
MTDELKRDPEDDTLANLDYLTGLPNRRRLYTWYSELGENTLLHAMFVDIDNFKRINDIYGHSMGDRLLVCVSDHIRTVSNSFTARIGGDEFVVIFDGHLSQDEVYARAEALIEGMSGLDFRRDILSLISLSIGIVLNQHARQSLDEILSRCDAAMYQSKYNGKNQYTVYDSEDRSFEISRNIELEMEDALASGQFKVFFQPKVNMISHDIVGAEALSRWQHPLDGLRLPGVYIPVFEKNGFISQLDMFIYEETCRYKSRWRGRSYANTPISVNMSRLHLYDREFPMKLMQIADRYGIPHGELEVEITEGVFIKDAQELIHMTMALQELGFMVSIDDFGSGFSSLNLLKDLEVDTVKIDKEFLKNSTNSPRGRHILRSIIAMCRDLKIQVVTEGIETKEQVDFISHCGCQIAQGFYYAGPLPADKFEDFAAEYKQDTLEAYRFRLGKGAICSEEGGITGRFSGDTTGFVGHGGPAGTAADIAQTAREQNFTYVDGILRDHSAISFPGGSVEHNVIEISPDAIVNDSYAVSVWIRPRELHSWASVIYIKFETGFASFSPLAWEGHGSFRIRNSREVNGWYDTAVCQLKEDCWWHVVLSYNAITENAVCYINGEPIAITENVPTNRYVKRIMVGGDVFQPSFIGDICELVFFNDAKDYDFVRALHHSYIDSPDYTGGALRSLL